MMDESVGGAHGAAANAVKILDGKLNHIA